MLHVPGAEKKGLPELADGQSVQAEGTRMTIRTRGRKAFMVGGGIGSMAAAAFLIRDGGMPGADITIYEAQSVSGGSLDGAGNPQDG